MSQHGEDPQSVTGVPKLPSSPHTVSLIVQYTNSNLCYNSLTH